MLQEIRSTVLSRILRGLSCGSSQVTPSMISSRFARRLIGMVAGIGIGVFNLAAQVTYTEDATDLINDYVSIDEFSEDGNTEGWGHNQAAIAPLQVGNGVLNVSTTGGDPWFFRAGLSGLTPEMVIAEVRIRLLAGTGQGWELFWG